MPTLQADIDGFLTLAGVPLGGFQTVSGFEETAEVVDDFPPGGQYADKSVGKAALGNGTFTRSWVESRDRPLYNQLKGRTGAAGSGGRYVRDTNRNVTDVESFAVKLVRFVGPAGDTNAGTSKATFEIEVATTGRS